MNTIKQFLQGQEQIIEFANTERIVVTGEQEEITTLNQATDFLLLLGYIVEEM